MTRDEKAKYLRMALALQNIVCQEEMAIRIVTTYEAVLKKEGKFSIKDAVEIELRLNREFAEKKLKNEPDKP